ncbi:MAG: hypothetical protein D6812_11580 [Deltaproteobacteria bacterium]|nr:MAG: hypothetical protein D6812_11580 [Deltaproteobacteria bacterium]
MLKGMGRNEMPLDSDRNLERDDVPRRRPRRFTFDPVWFSCVALSAILHVVSIFYIETRVLPPRAEPWSAMPDLEAIPLEPSEITLFEDAEILKRPEVAVGSVQEGEATPSPPPRSTPKPPEEEDRVTRKGLLGLITAKTGEGGAFERILSRTADRDASEILSKIDGVRLARRRSDTETFALGIEARTDRTVDIEGVARKPLSDLAGIQLATKEAGRITLQGTSPDSIATATISPGPAFEAAAIETIRKNAGAVQYCYNQELKKGKRLAGKLVIEFTIGTDGTVQRVRVIESASTLDDEDIRSCLTTRLQRWRFPHPPTQTVLRFPFLLIG